MGLEESLRSVKFEQGTTPKLEVLKFGTSAYINSSSVLGLSSLSSLKEVLLEGHYYESELAYVRTELAKNPNRPVMKRV